MKQMINDDQRNTDSDEIVSDPVCGMMKPKSEMKFTSEFLGKTYYFDTNADKDLFDAHPDYWVSKEEREKARSNLKTI